MANVGTIKGNLSFLNGILLHRPSHANPKVDENDFTKITVFPNSTTMSITITDFFKNELYVDYNVLLASYYKINNRANELYLLQFLSPDAKKQICATIDHAFYTGLSGRHFS